MIPSEKKVFFLKLDHFLSTFCKKCNFTIENPKKLTPLLWKFPWFFKKKILNPSLSGNFLWVRMLMFIKYLSFEYTIKNYGCWKCWSYGSMDVCYSSMGWGGGLSMYEAWVWPYKIQDAYFTFPVSSSQLRSEKYFKYTTCFVKLNKYHFILQSLFMWRQKLLNKLYK